MEEIKILERNNKKDDTLPPYIIGKWFTPSEWVGEVSLKNVTDIELSYGGGMGGSHRHEYVSMEAAKYGLTPSSIARSSGILKFVDIDGNDIYINTRFVVAARHHTLVTAALRNKGNYYHGQEGDVEYRRFLIKLDETACLSDEFQSNL